MSTPIVTGNVTGVLESVFHPEWTFNTTSGFMFQLNTSLAGNVTIGDTSTNYTLTLNGTQITGAGQGVASVNGITGAVNICQGSNVTITTVGSNNIIINATGGGGTAGVTSISGLTGSVGLSAGSGIDITVNTATSEVVFVNTGVTTICGYLSRDVGIIAKDTSVTVGLSGTSITISAAAGGGDITQWANSPAIAPVNLCGQVIEDTSSSLVTISGGLRVTDSFYTSNNFFTQSGNLTVQQGNLIVQQGTLNVQAGLSTFGGDAYVANMLNLGRSSMASSPLYTTINGYFDIAGLRLNYGQTMVSITPDPVWGPGFGVIDFCGAFAAADYTLFLSPVVQISDYPVNARVLIGNTFNSVPYPVTKFNGSCAVLLDVCGYPNTQYPVSVYYFGIGRAP